MSTVEAQADAGLRRHQFEFRGQGSEYFGIWIVNLLLTIITLGIYGAWAKVRTWRYFYANTFIGDHELDYHASPVRILIGRLIAIGFLVLYSATMAFSPRAGFFWVPFFLVVFPWLINSSLRFNARNTSYRNVRLNFRGTYWSAIKAYVLWPIAGGLSLFTLIPIARRAQDYFYVNNHTFGGRPFRTEYTGWQTYRVHLLGFGIIVLGIAVAAGAMAPVMTAAMHGAKFAKGAMPPEMAALMLPAILLFYFFIFLAVFYINTAIFNLSIGHMILDEKHRFESKLRVLPILWIAFSNLFLLVITLGLYYPWALVRMRRYMTSKLALLAATDLDEFTSEVVATQGAIGEEVAAFFDINIGL
jgi:uncharacterized membrane protein YjgN (DUF898 family)